MPQTIESLREILEMDPHSKVYLPLARLLLEAGEYDEALARLEQGLAAAPRDLEAQLLRLEALDGLDRDDDLRDAASLLGDALYKSPGFWRAWGSALKRDNASPDLIAAVELIAAHVAGGGLSWADVIMRGLAASLTPEAQRRAVGPAAVASHTVPKSAADPAGDTDFTRAELRDSAMAPDAAEALEQACEAAAKPSELLATARDEGQEERPGEAFSLRTRTMADLLARQGDYDGALDIYRELLGSTPPGAGKAELERLIEETQANAQSRAGKAPEPKPRTPRMPKPLSRDAAEAAPESSAISEEAADSAEVSAPEVSTSDGVVADAEAPAEASDISEDAEAVETAEYVERAYEPAADAPSEPAAEGATDAELPAAKTKPAPAANNLINTLESLAQRLEARAAG